MKKNMGTIDKTIRILNSDCHCYIVFHKYHFGNMGYCIGHFSSGVCTYIIHQLLPIVFAIWHQYTLKNKK
jgi:hypothetical protein